MREHAAVLLGFALSVLPGPQHPTPGPERAAAWSEPPSLVQEVRERIRTRLEAGDIPGALIVDGERIHARDALSRFYEERAFEPAWIDEGGPSAATARRGPARR